MPLCPPGEGSIHARRARPPSASEWPLQNRRGENPAGRGGAGVDRAADDGPEGAGPPEAALFTWVGSTGPAGLWCPSLSGRPACSQGQTDGSRPLPASAHISPPARARPGGQPESPTLRLPLILLKQSQSRVTNAWHAPQGVAVGGGEDAPAPEERHLPRRADDDGKASLLRHLHEKETQVVGGKS